jgi:prevent-host-death family protein
MKTISVSEFRAHCLDIVDEVHSTRGPVLITKRGKPFLQLMPAGRAPKFIGRLKGRFEIIGDIVSPITPLEDWTYDLDNLDGKRSR